MKSHLIFFILFIIVSLFASQKLLTNKFYTSHDGEGHVIRMIEFDEAIADGQFPVRIAKRINHGLGYPFFNFNYPFIYYLSEGFHTTGLSFVDSFKTIFILSAILGVFSVYFLTMPYFGKAGAFTSALFFTIAPYKFLNMYVRGDVAESLGLACIPLVLFAIDYFVKEGKYKFQFFILAQSMLILSHNSTAMIGLVLGIVFFYFQIRKAKKKRTAVQNFIFALSVSLLLTAFFWIPVLIESRLTKLVELTYDYKDFFPTLREVIYSPWGFGLYKQGDYPGKMSPQIGVIHIVIFLVTLMICIIRAVKKERLTRKDRFVRFFIGVTIVSLFLSLPFSKILWDTFYPLKLVQIPWRFIGFVTLGCSVVSGYLVSSIKFIKLQTSLVFILLIFLLYTNRNHIRVNQYITFENPFVASQIYGPSTTSKDEHMPKWAPRVFTDPSQDGDIIPVQNGTSTRLVWTSNYHLFTVQLLHDASFRDNTSYFPGWISRVDGVEEKILYAEDEFGRLRLHLPKGEHRVEFFFKETRYRLIADNISLLACISIVFLSVINLAKKVWIRQKH